jgi:hypothetical protein
LKPRRWLLAALAITTCAVVAVKRDRDQQRRLDELSARIAALSDAAQALAPPLEALPALLAQRRCALDMQDIDRIVRAAAGAKGYAVPTTVAPAPDKPDPSPPLPEQTAALDRAKARFADAIARHTLTRDDVLEMRAQLTSVGTVEAEALRARVATAINHRELVPQDRHFVIP